MSGGHAFRDIVAKDHARQHNGDVYNSNVINTTNCTYRRFYGLF
jgi:hypothetical protein